MEFDFIGDWHVGKLKVIENKDDHSKTESKDSLEITFLSNQVGFFNHDTTNNFIWGTQCYPGLILISQQLHSPDSNSIEFYTTNVYMIKDEFLVDSIVLWGAESKITSAGLINTLTYWTLTR